MNGFINIEINGWKYGWTKLRWMDEWIDKQLN